MSDQVRISLKETAVTPGASLAGQAEWNLDDEPRKVRIRLFWQTAGKGSTDTEVVDEIDVPGPRVRQTYEFNFKLPVEPYSFRGRLVSLEWGVEVMAAKQVAAASFVMAPDGIARQL